VDQITECGDYQRMHERFPDTIHAKEPRFFRKTVHQGEN
jgi:hypothetical protein